MIDPGRFWWPIATLAEIPADRPLARTLWNLPLVVMRDVHGNPAVLHDRCPHRHAPLSEGRCRQGVVECPYHGWRFSADGRCVDVPGTAAPRSGPPLVPSHATRSEYGLLWVASSPASLPAILPAPAVVGGVDTFFMSDVVDCTIEQAAENFLDGSHTHFVHAGWIRRDDRRQAVRASVHRLADGIEARYRDEGTQSGWVSRLLERDRVSSAGRFRLPGLAEIEYRGKNGITLLVTAWLSPETDTRLRVLARVATRRGLSPAWLKRIVLTPVFEVIMRQDKTILESVSRTRRRFERAGLPARRLDSPMDLLGPSIRRLLAGEQIEVEEDTETVHRL